jgi:hypothetical protein
MSKLHLDALTVQSFATSDSPSADQPAAQPGISDGAECNQTLYFTCGTCKCNTVDYNCA